MRRAIVLAALLTSGFVLAQTSTNFTLEEYTLNSGGTPSQGVDPTSVSFSITLASMGDGVVATGLASSSFGMDVGFDVAYPPPGEVGGLLLTDKQTLVWSAEPSAGVYDLVGPCDTFDHLAPEPVTV